MKFLITSLPSSYYFSTRYERPIKAIFYCIKYFGFYVLYFFLVSDYNLSIATLTFIIYLLFYNLYDLFCYQNDVRKPSIVYSGDDLPTHRKIKILVEPKRFIVMKAWYEIILLGVVLFWFRSSFIAILTLLIVLSVFFYLHNSFKGIIKGLTLFALYFLKSMIFFIPFIDKISKSDLIFYFLLSILFNLAYVPKYILRKTKYLRLTFPDLHKIFFFQAIILKNLFLFPLIFLDPIILILIVFIDIITLMEFSFDYFTQT